MTSKTKIAFFGASVTRQNTGYVYHFKNLDKLERFEVSSFAYGSMHMKDAGVCFIDEVLKINPEYCFLDWFSTAYIPRAPELLTFLDNFRYRFLTNNCQIIFLLFGGSKKHMSADRLLMFDLVRAYAAKHLIPIIDVFHYQTSHGLDPSSLFRDVVHTTDLGSQSAGAYVFSEFCEKILGNSKINELNLIKNEWFEVKKLFIEKALIAESLRIKGSAKLIGIYQKIGPFSGLVEVITDGRKSKLNLWDRWCFYERETLKISINFQKEVTLLISQEDFDRSSKKGDADWNVSKVIKPLGPLFYLGEISQLDAV